jgi:hypothetical protein
MGSLGIAGTPDEEIIKSYVAMCRHVRKGCNFDIQKCFIDGKPLIIEGSHLEPNLYVGAIPPTTDESGEPTEMKLKIVTPDPVDEDEASLENEPMKKMRKAMNAVDQTGAMIIPFLLTITP